MALIKCVMCGKDISPNAVMCPNCGEPMNNKKDVISSEDGLFPELPLDLSIGKQRVNWFHSAAIKGFLENNCRAKSNMKDGAVTVILHEAGIKICGKLYKTLLQIHNSQIVSINEISKTELNDKSVIEKALLGNVLFGKLGDLTNDEYEVSTKNKKGYYLIINYYDTESRKLSTISIECDSSSKRFIERFNKQKSN